LENGGGKWIRRGAVKKRGCTEDEDEGKKGYKKKDTNIHGETACVGYEGSTEGDMKGQTGLKRKRRAGTKRKSKKPSHPVKKNFCNRVKDVLPD